MVSTDDGREMLSRGRLALENSDVAGAITLMRSAADRFAADKNLRGEAAALANLGAACARAKQFGPALQALMCACRIFGEMDRQDPEANLGLGTAMFSLASSMCDTGRSFDAAQTFETASGLLRAVGKFDLAEDAVRRRTTLIANLPTGLSKDQ
jgi:hypothetical protein